MGRMRRKEKRKGENGRDKEKRMKWGGGLNSCSKVIIEASLLLHVQ